MFILVKDIKDAVPSSRRRPGRGKRAGKLYMIGKGPEFLVLFLKNLLSI